MAKDYYPGCHNVVQLFKGGAKRLHELLVALDPLETKSPSACDLQWLGPFRKNTDLLEIERMICWSCSAMTFQPGFDLCIDDDKLRNRSFVASRHFGMSRNKSPKAFGPVFNMAALTGTGMFVSGTISCLGDGVDEVNNRLFRRVCRVEENNYVKLDGSKVASDRAYNGDYYQKYVVSLGGTTLNTVKRTSTLPYVFGKVGFKVGENQRMIPEQGPKNRFLCTPEN